MADTDLYRRPVTVTSEHGLHIRPCQLLAQAAQKFRSTIRLSKGDLQVDAKSVFDLMSLAAGPGVVLELEATGPDAAEALQAVGELFDQGFAAAPPAVDSSRP